MAFVLTFAMIAGLVPAMSGGANKVQAASGSGTEPSVSAYATKTQLMDNTFAPNADGTAENYGMIVFGKKSDGTTAQEWYILGKDTGVSGDNTIIVAASTIARWQKFNSDISNKNDENLWSDCVYSEATITEVYANHYGASELRDTLQGMATNTSYFTSAEQGLMNATTVTTKDTKNSSVTYTTTDKLYALQGDYDNDQYLWAGTDDSTVLAMRSYLRNGEWFWLRSPYGGSGDFALCADRGYYVILGRVDIDSGSPVQPASNLDLSSVLFASAASFFIISTTRSAARSIRTRDGTPKTSIVFLSICFISLAFSKYCILSLLPFCRIPNAKTTLYRTGKAPAFLFFFFFLFLFFFLFQVKDIYDLRTKDIMHIGIDFLTVDLTVLLFDDILFQIDPHLFDPGIDFFDLFIICAKFLITELHAC